MDERKRQLGGLDAIAVGDPAAPLAVVVLHGREMAGADLAPFAHSLGGAAYFVFPDGPLPSTRARTWWPVDSEARIRGLAGGPMELSAMNPPGRAEARALLGALLDDLLGDLPGDLPRDLDTADRRFVLVGFSQGGMLAMDHTLHGGRRPAALALLSSTRIAIDDWRRAAAETRALADLPVLVAHGHADQELSFRAGELLRDFAVEHGARTTWLPFDGGHEIPLVVWRALRRMLKEIG